MKKKSILYIIAFFAIALKTQSQSLSPSVLASTGGYSKNASNSLSYTVGEMSMVHTFGIGTSNILTQGFQQPNDFPTGLLSMTQDVFGSFVVYPNPAVDNYTLGFQLPEPGRVSISLYNELGQKVASVYDMDYERGEITTSSNINSLSSGIYFVKMAFAAAANGKTQIITKKLQVIR